MKVPKFIKIENIVPELKADNKTEVLKELAGIITSNSSNLNYQKTFETLQERENLCSTAMDEGVAIPHCKLHGISNIIIAFGKSSKGIDFDSLDNKTTSLFIMILSPENSSKKHIQALAKISNIFKTNNFRNNILKSDNAEEILELITEEDESKE